MKTKKITFLLLVFSLVGFIAGWVLKKSTEFGLCLISEPTCINNFTWVGDGLFYGMSALSVVFLILLFIPQAFSAWKKFAKWFIPIATLIFIFYPDPGSGDLFSPYPEQVFRFISVFYVIASIFVIFKSLGKK